MGSDVKKLERLVKQNKTTQRNLKKLTKEKNAARKALRMTRRQAHDEEAVKDLSIKLYTLL